MIALNSLTISLVVFGAIVTGIIIGMVIRRRLPEHHLSQESKEVVKLGMGLIGTMTALVLGLLTASAKGTFDTQSSGVMQLSANVGLLDRIFSHYGPEAQDVRQQLRASVVNFLEQTWPEGDASSAGKLAPSDYGGLYDTIQSLTPKNDAQRTLQAAALKTATDIGQSRFLMFVQQANTIPTPFLVVLVFWLAMLFASFSMLAKPNVTVVVSLLIS
ncbi:hypothetical protein BH11PLA2_BH11PLA2_46530 [soil metagenome]